MKAQQKEIVKALAMTFGVAVFSGAMPVSAQESSMKEMVVTASRAQEARREVNSNVTVIGEEEIKASNATTVADIMQQQGFFIVTTGDTSNVQIRGLGVMSMANAPENQVLIVVNGNRVGTTNLGILGLANVERIEIIRSPSAVQYGSNALGGVINIITKRGVEMKPYFSLEVGKGSDDLSKQTVALGGAIGGFDYALGFSNSSRDDVTTADFGRWHHTEIDHKRYGNIDLGYTFSKNHRVGLSYTEGDTQSNLPDTGKGGYIRLSNSEATAYNEYAKKNKNTALSYTGHTDDKTFDWSANYSFGREDLDYRKSNGYISYVKNTMMNAQAGYNGQMVSFAMGVDSVEYNQYSTTAPAKPEMLDNGVYYTGKLRLLDEKLIFSIGGRFDKYENKSTQGASVKDDHFGGSYGVAWLPVEGFKLRANFAQGFKMPSVRQMHGDGQWYIANPNVLPEKSDTWEIGTDVQWRTLAASLTYFHTDFEDKIAAFYVPAAGKYQFQNLGSAKLAGVEGSVRIDLGKEFGKAWSLSPYASFTWLGTRENGVASQDITYKGSKTDELPRVPEWMLSYGVDFAHPAYKLKSRLSAMTYGSMLQIDYSRTGRPYVRTPSGTVVNLSVDKEILELSKNMGVLSLRGEINNLFDGANEMYRNYPGEGRSFYVGLRYDYK